MPACRAISTTAPTIASSSRSRPASKSWSIDVLCSPTAGGAVDASIDRDRHLLPERRRQRLNLEHYCPGVGASQRVGADLGEGGACEDAEGIEGDVAPELDPDLVADARPHWRLEPGPVQHLRQRLDAVRARTVRLAEAEAIAFDVAYDAGLDKLAGGVDDAADGALGADCRQDRAPRVHALEAGAGKWPFVSWKYHQGMPFWAVTTAVSGPSSVFIPASAGATWWALRVRMT